MTDQENTAKLDAQEMSTQRTEWSEDRTLLANERTFAAWMRTGMACIGIALGLRAVFGSTDYPMGAKLVAELFILCAVIIFWAAVRRSYATKTRISANDTFAASSQNMILTASVMTIGAISTGVILWLL